MDKQINIKHECEAIIENNMEDTIIFYFQEYPEKREEFYKELIDTFIQLLKNIKNQMEEEEEIYNNI